LPKFSHASMAKNAKKRREAGQQKENIRPLKVRKAGMNIMDNKGSESEFATRCVEQKGLIDGYVKRISELECERKELDEWHTKTKDREEDREDFDAEKERMEKELATMKEEHAMELQKVLNEGAYIKKLCGRMNDMYNAVQAELESTQTKLTETIQSKEELKALTTSGAKCATVTAEKESLDMELQQAQSDISELQARVSNLEEELTKSQQVTSTLQMEKEASEG